MRSAQAEMPLPINWSLIGKVKPQVDARRKLLREQTDPVVRKCTLIRIGMSFFQRVNGANIVTSPSELHAAAFESPELAEEAVRARLKSLEQTPEWNSSEHSGVKVR